MKQKLIFLDIDGTLTLPGTNVPPLSAQEAVRKARSVGHKVFLCTGRNDNMLSPLLPYGFDGYIACSGARVVADGQVLFDNPLTEEESNFAREVFGRNGLYITVECADGSFTDDGLKDFLREHSSEGSNSEVLRWREQLESALGIRPIAEYRGQPIYKMVMMAPSRSSMDRAVSELKDRFLLVLQENRGIENMYNGELTGRGYDKGRAIARICAHMGCSLADTIGFGDSMNDLEMIRTAGIGVVMENGSEALKREADIICPAVDHDGIQKAFEQLGLFEEITE